MQPSIVGIILGLMLAAPAWSQPAGLATARRWS